jgi:Uncharacterised nucleotidyltransferase
MHRHPIGDGRCAPRIPREVAALIAALQLKGGNAEALGELEQREWESLLRFCDLAHLTLLLSQVEAGDSPSWVVERLERNVADNAARFERIKATYQEAASAFDRAGVEYVMLKGFTQAPEYVSDARLRMQSDLDVYCPKEMIGRAKAALVLIGYQPEQTVDYSHADHLPSLIRQGDWQWRGNAFDPEMPLSIELHFCLWNEGISWFPVPEVDRFWDRRIRRSLGDMSFPDLSPVDHLGYLAIHILRGLLCREWVIHHVHELATFLHTHAKSDEFWREWKETHSDSFRALQAISFAHARAWFSCDIHSDIQSEIAAMPPIHREWLDRFAGSALDGMFCKNKDGVWLHASLVKPSRKRLSLIWQTIVPTRVSSVDGPAVRIKDRELKESGIRNKYLRYAGYVVSRTLSHVRPVPTMMWRGMILWLSQR